MKLTEHFTLKEMTDSELAARHKLDNIPNSEEIENLIRVAKLGEEVRSLVKTYVIVSSGFRSETVNNLAGGRPDSQHRLGCAMDFRCPGWTPREIVTKIIQSGIAFDQLILEYDSWVHISVPRKRDQKPRMQALIIDHESPLGRAFQ